MADVGFDELRVGQRRATPVGTKGRSLEKTLRRKEIWARKQKNEELSNRERRADLHMRDFYGVKNSPTARYSYDQRGRERIRAGLNNQLMIDPSAGSATRKVNSNTEAISKAFYKLENYISGTGDEFENGIVLGANDELINALKGGGYDYLAGQVQDYATEFKTAKHYDDSTYARAMLEITKYQQEIRDRIDVDWIYSEVLDSPSLAPAKPKAPTAVDSQGRTWARDPATGRVYIVGGQGDPSITSGDWEPGQIR